MEWSERYKAYEELVREREQSTRLPSSGEDRPDFRVAGAATAAWAAGLAALMLDRRAEAERFLRRAAEVYRRSYALAPPGSWGRPLAALRCRLIAGDEEGARADASWTLAEGAAEADSAVARYAAAVALLALGRDAEALSLAEALAADGAFAPPTVARALVAIAGGDAAGYADAAAEVLADFESRDAFLEDVAVADTVLVLDRLAAGRGIHRPPRPSRLLPPEG